jgi:hypothetical protein
MIAIESLQKRQIAEQTAMSVLMAPAHSQIRLMLQ